MKKIVLLSTLLSLSSFANTAKLEGKVKKGFSKEEVLENPTLKTLSGALNQWSFYSSFTYNGGSLSDPTSAERPNINSQEDKPGLASAQGNLGVKFRLTKQDNFSLQVGLYSTTPFHSSYEFDDKKTQSKFDENSQNVDFDDPTLSYFRTYTIGGLQNISFVKFQYATRGVYRDSGTNYGFAYSHAAAYKLNKFSYIAGSLTYENYQYFKDTVTYQGREVPGLDYQLNHRVRGNLSAEFYVRRNIAFRLITDLFNVSRTRANSDFVSKDRQQTVAMTYFFTRDISIAPNIKFIASDMRADRTNLGLSMNINL